MKTSITVLLAVLVAGCAGVSREPPVSLAQSAAGGPPNQQPQPPNSLPLGSQVEAPFTAPTGIVSTTQVGPGTRTGASPVTSARQPLVSPGTATAPERPGRLGTSY